MKYVIADVHGDYEKYTKMLELIQFSEEDELYVLGDVLDRGENGLKILQDMMLRPNVIPILGNHEYMASVALPWLLKEVTEENVESFENGEGEGLIDWIRVGGTATIEEFTKLSREEQLDVLDYLMEFSLYEIVEAKDKEFVLVHAGLHNFSKEKDLDDYDLYELLFCKPDYDKVYFTDKYLVTGHTVRKEVLIQNNHIAIDCGCGYDGRLACVCLDTLQTFYV